MRIQFKSNKINWKKEYSGLKRNTQREFADEESSEVRKMFRKILCKIGIHKRCKTNKSGDLLCIDCGYVKSRFEHQADLHAGGGW